MTEYETGSAGGVPRRCVVDTNVLVYATVRGASKHEEARRWMARLEEATDLCATAQIFREYLVVLTRGEVFEHTFTPVEALEALGALRSSLTLLTEQNATPGVLSELVATCEVAGKQIHDANIVATMKTHGVRHLATYNRGDFERYPNVVLLPLPEQSLDE